MDRNSFRSPVPKRRCRLSADCVPLARRDIEPEATPAAQNHEAHPQAVTVNTPSLSPVSNSQLDRDSLPEDARTMKRAATEDSDNHGSNKKVCFELGKDEQPAAATASWVASKSSANPSSCLTQVTQPAHTHAESGAGWQLAAVLA